MNEMQRFAHLSVGSYLLAGPEVHCCAEIGLSENEPVLLKGHNCPFRAEGHDYLLELATDLRRAIACVGSWIER